MSGSREEWIDLMAQGRGRSRQRIKVTIPVYGNLKFSDCEKDALSLPPKHAEYEKFKRANRKGFINVRPPILNLNSIIWHVEIFKYSLKSGLR